MTRKNKVMLVLSVLLVATIVLCSALAPVVLFEMGDRSLFAATNTRSGGTGGTLSQYVEDIPMVQALRNREEMNYSYSENTTQYLSQQSKEEAVALLPRMYNYAQQLYEAGVIDTVLWEYMDYRFGTEGVNFTHWVNTAGFEGITCNFGLGTVPPYYIYIEVEIQTDKIVSIDMNLPSDDIIPFMDMETTTEEQLNNFIAWLELDTVHDWAKDDYYWGGIGAYDSYSAALFSPSPMLSASSSRSSHHVPSTTVPFSFSS